MAIESLFRGRQIKLLALTFLRIKYCCCYGEKSRDSLASVFTQIANSNSAVQSTQLIASSTKHVFPGAHLHGVSSMPP